jgi:Uma2 family endonuclease
LRLFRVLPFQQVATKTQIRAEDYLRMTFEHDAEFVHGDIVERPMPDKTHARIQFLLTFQFGQVAQVQTLYPYTEFRLKVAPDIYRIPDLTVYAGSPPVEEVPSEPPLIVIEIVSKDERYSELTLKLEEYRQWGVPNIWVIDPHTRRFASYNELGLQNVSSLNLTDYSFQLTPAELFSQL